MCRGSAPGLAAVCAALVCGVLVSGCAVSPAVGRSQANLRVAEGALTSLRAEAAQLQVRLAEREREIADLRAYTKTLIKSRNDSRAALAKAVTARDAEREQHEREMRGLHGPNPVADSASREGIAAVSKEGTEELQAALASARARNDELVAEAGRLKSEVERLRTEVADLRTKAEGRAAVNAVAGPRAESAATAVAATGTNEPENARRLEALRRALEAGRLDNDSIERELALVREEAARIHKIRAAMAAHEKEVERLRTGGEEEVRRALREQTRLEAKLAESRGWMSELIDRVVAKVRTPVGENVTAEGLDDPASVEVRQQLNTERERRVRLLEELSRLETGAKAEH